MERKNSKIIILFLLFLAFFLNTLIVVKADSGWDSSYDGGGSSWGSSSGGSSWGGGSSWDNDYYYGGSSSGGNFSTSSDPLSSILFVVIIIFFLVLVSVIASKKNSGVGGFEVKRDYEANYYNDIDIEKAKAVDSEFNIEEFKTTAFNIYKDIQTAWMDFDTDTIRKLTTDELYNMYSAQLTTLKVKKQKNIMKNIEYIDAKVIEVNNVNGINTVVVYLNVKCLDYVIDEKTNKTLRGIDDRRLNIKYLLTFVKDSTNNNEIEKCPNCGAPVDIIASATCPYCDSVLVKNASKYVLSKKTCVGQDLD